MVTVDPVRILDTRTDVGLPGSFVSAVSQKLQVTGAAVPAGATGVLSNVTVVAPGPPAPAGPAGATGPAGPVNRISDRPIALFQWYQDPGRIR